MELASCQFNGYFRAWNWHLASFMPTVWVELASCQFNGYFRAGRMPTLLLLIPRQEN
ncbi:hypothetical protein [Moorena sp. SIO3H5]|uniref:hypothetical protein n=1 Tax=Moorena sp. SIO3H5 TaxID=2607834 RepID=UPI0013B77D3C|nr:hypothetical protein [Moorena sp. SIO3H5]NEO72070.1 hypothetical protein [Moorena sp. SIO3H5]